jgi:serine phosphatase RsbU (regulator of sigma subunit)
LEEGPGHLVNPQQEYLRRLADIDATVASAQIDPDVVLERAAGLLAGRAGCRITEAHAQLLQFASEQGRDPGAVAADVVAGLESQLPVESARVRALVGDALRPPRRRVGDRLPPVPERATASPVADDGGWRRVMQQVLDALPGNNTVVLPLRNPAGQVEDFAFVAVSPSVVDLSGRHGAQVVGRPVSEVYPAIVGSPVWQAWHDTLTDGVPREVGPVPYEGGDDVVPVTIIVRVNPVGPGLLSSWVRPDEQRRLSERIAQTERLGSLGWGEWDLLSDSVVWSDELYRIYERDPAAGPLPREQSEALRLPDDAPLHRQAIVSFGRGETVDITYRVRIGDQVKHLRTVVDAVRDATGRPIKVYGIVQDVTVRETSRAKLAEVEQQLREQQRSLAAEHQLAAQLQHIILPIPAAPIDLPGLQVAVRYLPAEQASRVGGDWYHAAATDDGDVLLAVGDVAGHGIRAATTMARLRHALAALSVTTTIDPAELLSHLNRLLYADGSTADTTTAVIARYHPPTGTLIWAQAGHPPLLHTRDAVTAELDRPHGPLLGALRDATYDTASTTIQGGDLLLFYTDGLVEHRRQSRAEGYVPVIATLNEISTAETEQPLTDVLARLRSANLDDDTCILAARPIPTGRAGSPPDRD